MEDSDVLNPAEVWAGCGVKECDRILALDEEAGDVEGSEGDPSARVRQIVATAAEMVQPCWNIDHQLVIHDDL